MTAPHTTLNGQRLTALRVTVPNIGPWTAECDLESAAAVQKIAEIQAGALRLLGTVVETQSGVFAQGRRVRVVGGSAGWSKELRAQAYHNDAGVSALTVARDAANATGETISTFVPAAEKLGSSYARAQGQAARTLEDVIGGAAWWVDYLGVTQVGPRPERAAAAKDYEVLAFDPRQRIVTLAVEDPSLIGIGSVLSERLAAPVTVREFELTVDAEQVRISAWVGGSETEPGRLAGLLRAISERTGDRPLWGKYRYRVVQMLTDHRVSVQAVRRAAGLPDLTAVSVWPGVAGVHAELAPGAEILIEFVEGSAAMPIITHFAGPDGVGFVPVSIVFCQSTQAAARQGDLVQSGGTGTIVTLQPVTGVGAPPNNAVVCGVPHMISFSSVPPTPIAADPLYGAISTGSPKVFL